MVVPAPADATQDAAMISPVKLMVPSAARALLARVKTAEAVKSNLDIFIEKQPSQKCPCMYIFSATKAPI
ncbi:hypothetical protein D3C77_491710 [compost metagenome]